MYLIHNKRTSLQKIKLEGTSIISNYSLLPDKIEFSSIHKNPKSHSVKKTLGEKIKIIDRNEGARLDGSGEDGVGGG